MAKIVQPLTNTQIANVKTTDSDKSLFDGDGLLLLVKSSGVKIWRFRYYKPIDKKRTTITFGNYPALGLADARRMRESALTLLAQGIDPQKHKQEQMQKKLDKENNTFRRVAEDWFKIESKKRFSEDTLKRKWNSLENHVLKYIGNEPITSITAQQLIKTLQPLSEKNNLDMLRRVIHRINQIMIYAQNIGIININKAQNIKAAFETAKTTNMPTIKPEELPEFMQALSMANIELQTRCVIEWQLLTMTRPSEASGTEWQEIDIDNKLWIISADRMKMKREHIIPLSTQAIRIIEIMKGITGHNKYMFPTMISPHNKPMSSETANNAIKNKLNMKERLVAHGLRSLASTALNEQKFSPDAIEVALSHVDRNKIRRAYNHALYLEERKIMMQWWGDFVEQASQGNVSLSGNRNLRIVND